MEGDTPTTGHNLVEQSLGSSSINTHIQTKVDESIGELSDHEFFCDELIEVEEAIILPIVDCTESIYISRNYRPIPRQPRITKTRYPILAERMFESNNDLSKLTRK